MAAAKTKVKERSRPREVLGAFSDEFGDLGQKTVSAFKKDVLEASGKDFIKQFFGITNTSSAESIPSKVDNAPEKNLDPTQGPVEIFNAAKLTPAEIADKQAHAKREKKTSSAEGAIDYRSTITRSGENAIKKDRQEKRSALQQKQEELRQIVRETKDQKYAIYSVQDMTRDATVYQSRFLDQVISGAMLSKQKAAESNTWLQAGEKREAKRGSKKATVANLTKSPHERPTSGIMSTG